MSFGRIAIGAVAIAAVAACAPHEHEHGMPKLNKAGAGSTGSSGVVGVHGSSGGTGTSGGWGGSSGSSGGASGSLCASCTSDADCGPGGFCVGDPSRAQGNCTVPCRADGSCDDASASCFQLTDDRGVTVGSGCFPESGACGVDGGSGSASGGTCAPCTRDGDCGPGGCCVLDGVAGAYCTAPCGDGDSCPTCQTCYQVGSSGETGCYPASLTCTAGTSGGSGCTSDTWSGYAEDFFEHNCQSCHDWTGSHEEVQESAPDIAHRIQTGEMPPGGGLSASDVDRIVKYLNCGAP